jgi:hypothetical protein
MIGWPIILLNASHEDAAIMMAKRADNLIFVFIVFLIPIIWFGQEVIRLVVHICLIMMCLSASSCDAMPTFKHALSVAAPSSRAPDAHYFFS